MIKYTFFSILILYLFIGEATAKVRNWMHVGDYNEGSVYFDVNNIEKIGSNVSVWKLVVLYKPIQTDQGILKTAVVNQLFFCGQRKSQIIKTLDYSGVMDDGPLIYSDSIFREVKDIKPGSVFDPFYKKFCE